MSAVVAYENVSIGNPTHNYFHDLPKHPLFLITARLTPRDLCALARASSIMAQRLTGIEIAGTKEAESDVSHNFQPLHEIWRNLLRRDFGISSFAGQCTAMQTVWRNMVAKSLREYVPLAFDAKDRVGPSTGTHRLRALYTLLYSLAQNPKSSVLLPHESEPIDLHWGAGGLVLLSCRRRGFYALASAVTVYRGLCRIYSGERVISKAFEGMVIRQPFDPNAVWWEHDLWANVYKEIAPSKGWERFNLFPASLTSALTGQLQGLAGFGKILPGGVGVRTGGRDDSAWSNIIRLDASGRLKWAVITYLQALSNYTVETIVWRNNNVCYSMVVLIQNTTPLRFEAFDTDCVFATEFILIDFDRLGYPRAASRITCFEDRLVIADADDRRILMHHSERRDYSLVYNYSTGIWCSVKRHVPLAAIAHTGVNADRHWRSYSKRKLPIIKRPN